MSDRITKTREAIDNAVRDALTDWNGDQAPASLITENVIAALIDHALIEPPTDDEREAGRLAIEGILKACMMTFATSYEDAAGMAIDKVIAAGFRRQGPVTDARPHEKYDTDIPEG